MIDVTVEIQGADVIVRGLDKLSNFGQAMKPAIVRSADLVRAEVSQYAPSTSANLPVAGRTFYLRGTGPVYVRKTDGQHTVRKTSQMLNRKWSTKYRFTSNDAEAIIGNNATYAPYVHDERKQARFHKARGWRTAQATVTKYRDRIRGFFEQAVRDALAQAGLKG
jgi:hypothetical protein